MADFFVLLRDGEGDEVRRLLLRRDVQNALSAAFEDAAIDLANEDTELIGLSNEAYKPDETEAWVVEGFELPEHIAGAFDDPVSCPTLAPTDSDLPSLRAIVAVYPTRGRQQRWMAFQAISRNQLISATGFSIILDGDTFRRLERPGLQVNNEVHAVLEDGDLVFRSLFWARRLFDLTEHYRTATDEDVANFIERDDVEVEDSDLFMEQADRWTRKRLALVMQSGVIENSGIPKIRQKAADYGIAVTVRRGRLVIPGDKREMKKLLKFLEEEYYTGPLTETPYVANSKRRAE